MVAVLPPLVTFGLLLGVGSWCWQWARCIYFGKPDLCEPCRGDNFPGTGHSSSDLVGESSRSKSDAYRHRIMGLTIGSIDRLDLFVANGLNMNAQNV